MTPVEYAAALVKERDGYIAKSSGLVGDDPAVVARRQQMDRRAAEVEAELVRLGGKLPAKAGR